MHTSDDVNTKLEILISQHKSRNSSGGYRRCCRRRLWRIVQAYSTYACMKRGALLLEHKGRPHLKKNQRWSEYNRTQQNRGRKSITLQPLPTSTAISPRTEHHHRSRCGDVRHLERVLSRATVWEISWRETRFLASKSQPARSLLHIGGDVKESIWIN